jgi:hypothetical protein
MVSSVLRRDSVEHRAQSNQADKIEREEKGAQGDHLSSTSGSTRHLMPLKVLKCSFVFLGCSLCLERCQIPALSSSRIFLPRIQPIFAGLEFPDHAASTLMSAARRQISCVLVRHLRARAPCCSSKGRPEQQESPNPAPGAPGNSSVGSRDRNSRK